MVKNVVVVFICFSSFVIEAETLSLREYVGLVLKNNTQVRAAAAGVAGSDAGTRKAFSSFLPQVQLRAGTNRGAREPFSADLFSGDSKGSYSVDLGGQQLLFDFGKARSLFQASKRTGDVSLHNERGTRQDVILNAYGGYYSYLLAIKIQQVKQDVLKQAQLHLEEANVLFTVGSQPSYAVAKARVDVANAQVGLIDAQKGLILSRVKLENGAGTRFKDSLMLVDSLNIREPDIELDSATDIALRMRPEVLAAAQRLAADRFQLTVAERSRFPSISANGSIGAGKTGDADWARDWSAGLGFSLNLFTGGSQRASIDQAKASVRQSQALLDGAVQATTLAVAQYYLERQRALQQIEATGTLVEQTLNGLTLSQERFKAGAATYLEIVDAEVNRANALISQAQAWFDYRTAHANLLRSMGVLE